MATKGEQDSGDSRCGMCEDATIGITRNGTSFTGSKQSTFIRLPFYRKQRETCVFLVAKLPYYFSFIISSETKNMLKTLTTMLIFLTFFISLLFNCQAILAQNSTSDPNCVTRYEKLITDTCKDGILAYGKCVKRYGNDSCYGLKIILSYNFIKLLYISFSQRHGWILLSLGDLAAKLAGSCCKFNWCSTTITDQLCCNPGSS